MESSTTSNEDLRKADAFLCHGNTARREAIVRIIFTDRSIHQETPRTPGSAETIQLSVYNIRIMEEAQSILALGAGGISKIYFPEENRLERVANVSNYEIYIDRLDEMMERKKNRIFWRK